MPLIELTASQLMALRDLVAEHLRCPNATEVYIDVVRDVETTPSDLLVALMQEEG